MQHIEKRLNVAERKTFYVMQSSGGLCSAKQASSKAITLLKSGLAAGVIGACEIAAQSGHPDIISVDIGGTSCDVALVTNGNPVIRSENKLQTFPIRVPMIDVNTVGAGGGSVAWLDDAGGLHVGPQSAGAVPGPACYGRGGSEPTVTDASVVLGYLNPDFFADGLLKLRAEDAVASIQSIAGELNMTVPEAASGIHQIVNSAMTDEIRKVSLQRGEDPRKFALVLLGGAGPVHGAELARDLEIRTLIVPAVPGLLAAYGLLFSRITHNQVVPLRVLLRNLELVDLIHQCSKLDREGRAFLSDESVAGDVKVHFTAHMRYLGQSFELDVEVPGLEGANCLRDLRTNFDDRHRRLYGRDSPDRDVELIGLSATHTSDQPRPPKFFVPSAGAVRDALKGHRSAYFTTLRAYVDTPVYDRSKLAVDEQFDGPAIIEQPDTTTVVPPDASVRVHRSGALIMSLEGQQK